MNINIKRIYAPYEKSDGFRILVDRLWPRGISKKESRIDLWLKDIAPSNKLRKWFAHEPEKWPEFQKKYYQELGRNKEQIDTICDIAGDRIVTLLYGAKDKEHNNAVALNRYLHEL